MRVGALYEQAVDLSPRAARIAAALLGHESTLPEPLRRSLFITLSACAKGRAGDMVHEGVLRRNLVTWTGYARDTAVYSILADEWPALKERA